jgi:hypothetical protein
MKMQHQYNHKLTAGVAAIHAFLSNVARERQGIETFIII